MNKPKVTIPIEQRWEEGVEHDARSEELFKFIRDHNYTHEGGSMGLRAGGDGDNGEELMYHFDEYFAQLDGAPSPSLTRSPLPGTSPTSKRKLTGSRLRKQEISSSNRRSDENV